MSIKYFKKLSPFKKNLLLIILILLTTFQVYLNLFKVPFVYDDYDFLFNWPSIQNFNHIPSLLSGDTPVGHEGVYRPLRSIFYLISLNTFGHNIFLYHLQELIIYSLCLILIYLITQKIFGQTALSFLTTLFYSLLPIHIDNIANLTANFDTIGVIFFLLSCYLFLIYIERKKNRSNIYLYFSLALSIMAVFTYEITLILPFIIIIYSFFKRQNISARIFLSYFFIIFIYLFIRTGLHIPMRGGLITNLPQKIIESTQSLASLPLISILPQKISDPAADVTGLLLLSTAKELPINTAPPRQNYLFLLSLIILAAAMIFSFYSLLKHRLTGFALMWFYICLLPVIAITFQSNPYDGEGQVLWGKYLIIASFGLSLLVANWFLTTTRNLFKVNSLLYLKALFILSITVLMIVNALTTRDNLNNYRDPRPQLLANVLHRNDDNEMKHNDLGVMYALYQRYSNAVAEFNKALKINPRYTRSRQNLSKLCRLNLSLPRPNPQLKKACL